MSAIPRVPSSKLDGSCSTGGVCLPLFEKDPLRRHLDFEQREFSRHSGGVDNSLIKCRLSGVHAMGVVNAANEFAGMRMNTSAIVQCVRLCVFSCTVLFTVVACTSVSPDTITIHNETGMDLRDLRLNISVTAQEVPTLSKGGQQVIKLEWNMIERIELVGSGSATSFMSGGTRTDGSLDYQVFLVGTNASASGDGVFIER
jgi:hypothetical protein